MTVSQQIIEVLDALCEKFGIAIDWANANVMPQITDLMQRAVLYCMVTSVAKLIFPIVYLVFYFWRIYRYKKDVGDVWPERYWFFVIFGGVACLFVIGALVGYINTIITCIILPEKVIYDMLTNMVSQ